MMKLKLARWVLLVSSILMISSCSVMKSHYGRGWTCHWNMIHHHSNQVVINREMDLVDQRELPCSADQPGVDIINDDLRSDLENSVGFTFSIESKSFTANSAWYDSDFLNSASAVRYLGSEKPISEKVEVLISGGRQNSPEDKWLLLLLAFFLPPLTVFLLDDTDSSGFITSILLTIFGCWIAGVVYSIIKVVRKYN